MAKAKNRQIDYLPQGWEWKYKGEQSWTTSQGRTSNERHGYNALTGETKSVRQIQSEQQASRKNLGLPKAAPIKRTGKIRTIKEGGPGRQTNQTNVTRSSTLQTGVGSLFNSNFRGKTETWVFYNIQDAQNYVIMNGLPEWANHSMLEVRYTERLVVTNKVGSDQRNRNGYASLTPFFSVEDIEDFAIDPQADGGIIGNPWGIAYQNIQNYDMTGDKARVYIYLAERG